MDYFETFAPVAKMTSFRLLLALSSMHGWPVTQLDVTNAFLHGYLDEEVYMSCPPGYTIPDHIMLKYLNQKLTSGDPSLFVYAKNDNLVYLLSYVDDMIMTGTDPSLMAHITEFLSSHFKIKDLGPLHYFLGIQIVRNASGIFMNQQKYIFDILLDFSKLSHQVAIVPMDQNHDLLQHSDSPILQDFTVYRRLVAQYMHSPTALHWYAALKLVKYLRHTSTQGLLYASKANPVLNAFCDADWGGCKTTRLSLTGYCVTFGGTSIAWKCKKQQVVSRSSAEAEYRSMADIVCELSWLVSLLTELHVLNLTPVPLFCDNQSALYIASNPVFHERTKHIEIDCHLVRQKLVSGLISTQHVSTVHQPADLFTKALASAQLSFLLSKLGVCSDIPTPHLKGAVKHVTKENAAASTGQGATAQCRGSPGLILPAVDAGSLSEKSLMSALKGIVAIVPLWSLGTPVILASLTYWCSCALAEVLIPTDFAAAATSYYDRN
ncbi:hypothetical protein AgCh_013797 [Apium graveolens]